VTTAIQSLTGSVTALNAAGLGSGLSRLGAFFGTPLGAGLGVAGVAAAGISVALSERDLNQRIAAQQYNFDNRMIPKDLEGNPIFAQAPTNITPLTGKLNLDRKPLVFDDATKTFKAVEQVISSTKKKADEATKAASSAVKKAKEFINDYGYGDAENLRNEGLCCTKLSDELRMK
jgi:hypothetical protein